MRFEEDPRRRREWRTARLSSRSFLRFSRILKIVQTDVRRTKSHRVGTRLKLKSQSHKSQRRRNDTARFRRRSRLTGSAHRCVQTLKLAGRNFRRPSTWKKRGWSHGVERQRDCVYMCIYAMYACEERVQFLQLPQERSDNGRAMRLAGWLLLLLLVFVVPPLRGC